MPKEILRIVLKLMLTHGFMTKSHPMSNGQLTVEDQQKLLKSINTGKILLQPILLLNLLSQNPSIKLTTIITIIIELILMISIMIHLFQRVKCPVGHHLVLLDLWDGAQRSILGAKGLTPLQTQLYLLTLLLTRAYFNITEGRLET
jgi:hypothetical protein